jgi:hypothetical protein
VAPPHFKLNQEENFMTYDSQPSPINKVINFLKGLWERLVTLYHPDTLKQQGTGKSLGLLVTTVLVLMLLLTLWWNREPQLFSLQEIQEAAKARAETNGEKIVPGYVTTNTLIEVASTLLDKSGGYLSNDILPPGVLMDDMPSWEWGVLQQIRDFTKTLRNDMSRSRTQSTEDPDLALAEPEFNTDSKSWIFPTSEKEYRTGISLLEKYLHRLADPKNPNAQFYARADNLRDWLKDVIKRLGSLSQRLSASVGQVRQNTNLAGDANARQSTTQPTEVTVKTPWLQIDNVFYEARGTSWALIQLLRAVEIDFKEVLGSRNALIVLQQVIRELETTQKTVWSPMVLNGSEFGLFANYSLVLSSYISRANTGIIELQDLLERG